MIHILATVFASVLLLQPSIYEPVTREDIQTWIYAYSDKYGINPDIPMAVARCESINFNDDVINNRRLGLAGEVGTFQFHPRGMYTETPQYYAGYSRYDQEANVAAGVWGLSHGLQRHWTCYRRIFR